MPIVAWLLSKLTSKIALPLLAGLLLTNIASGAGLWITRNTLAHRTRDLAAEVKDHAADLATIKAATAQAQADDQANALAHEKAQDAITTENENALQDQLASARAVTAKWVRNHAAPVVRSGSASAVPAAADAPSQPDSPPASAVVSATDLDACAIDYTVAKGWQDWYAKEKISMAAGGAIVPISEAVGTIRRTASVGAVLGLPRRDALETNAIVPGIALRIPDPVSVAGGRSENPIVGIQAPAFVEALAVADSVADAPQQRSQAGEQQQRAENDNSSPDSHSKNFLP